MTIDIDPLIELWGRSERYVILTNADGVVILASREDWRYRATRPAAMNNCRRSDEAGNSTGAR